MSNKGVLHNYDLRTGAKYGVILSVIAFLSGAIVTDISKISLLIRCILPVLMLMYPWFWVWHVPRKYFFEQAPKEYVLLFGWGIIIINYLDILLESINFWG